MMPWPTLEPYSDWPIQDPWDSCKEENESEEDEKDEKNTIVSTTSFTRNSPFHGINLLFVLGEVP
jgi:hypothetical protein